MDTHTVAVPGSNAVRVAYPSERIFQSSRPTFTLTPVQSASGTASVALPSGAFPPIANYSRSTMNTESHAKLEPLQQSHHSQQSPTQDDDHDQDHDNWSAGEGSSADDGTTRSQSGAAKRKRPLSVSCETCKQRKVKCDRGHPACGWCLKNHSQCVYLPRKKPGLRAGYGRELEARLGE